MKLVVDFESDWGVGSGGGRHGSLDRTIRRDADGLPMVPGKTLTGIIRDAASQAALALDNGKVADWHGWFSWIFGGAAAAGPEEAALSIRPGVIGDDVRDWFLQPRTDRPNSADLVAAAFLTHPGVRIGEESGAAADDTLRMVEFARCGLQVEAPIGWRYRDGSPVREVPEPAQILLGCALRLVRGLGGARRRGAGKCRIAVDGAPSLLTELASGELTDQTRQRIRDVVKSGPGSPPETPCAEFALTATSTADKSVQLLGHLTLTCKTPVAVAGATIGNVSTSLDFVPGGLLLPIVARVVGVESGKLIREGQLIVTDATVRSGVGPALPTPRALHESKHDRTGPFRNFLTGQFLPAHRAVGGWLDAVADGASASRVMVPLSQDAHAVIDAKAQRPTKESGGLFVQQAIAAGTVLVAELWGHQQLGLAEADWPETVEVGRSKKDDYGLASLTFTPHDANPGESESSCGCRSDGTLTVWLTSDLLLAAGGRPDPSPAALAALVARQTGREVGVGDARFVAWRRRESWSSRWGLPRPSLVGMAAGSVIVLNGLHCDGADCPWAALTDLADRGLGGRTAEGFGRVRLNDPLMDHEEINRSVNDGSAINRSRPPLSAMSTPQSVSVIEDAAWRTVVEEGALRVAVDPIRRREVIPPGASKAQLGTLRLLVEALDRNRADGQAQARAWLDSMDKNPSRAAAWRRTDRAPSIGEWLGLGSTVGVQPNDDPIEGALGLGPLGTRIDAARTVLLLLCISEEIRSRQLRDRRATTSQEALAEVGR